MAAKITWLGHGTWLIESGGSKILLDPFLNDNPSAPIKADDVQCDTILISHGHYDHVADAVKIQQRTGATILTNFEITQWLAGQGVAEDKMVGMNLGGSKQMPFGTVKQTLAHHSSTLPDGTPAGNPCGFLLSLAEGNVYFACDTALFLDMQLIGGVGLELAVLPIGDLFTMGPDDAVQATNLLKPKRVAPAHYGTWPPIAQDAEAWAKKIRAYTAAEAFTPEPGGVIELPSKE